jgi:hypothetical protein
MSHINPQSKDHKMQACYEHLIYLISLSLVHLEIMLPTHKNRKRKKTAIYWVDHQKIQE